MSLFYLDWLGIIPECFFGLALLFYFCFGIEKEKENPVSELSSQAQLVGLWVLFLLVNQWYLVHKTNWYFLFLNSYVVDEWSLSWKIFVILFTFFYVSFLKDVSFEYLVLILLFQFAVFFLLSSYHFLIFYLSLELSSFILYLLVGSKRESLVSTEGGLKYFVLGSFSSIILLFGIVLCYGLVGSLNFLDLYLWSVGTESLSFWIAILFISVGIFFKLGAAPFHFWLPDVYNGSTWSVVYFLVVVSKIGVLGMFLRFVYVVGIDGFESFSFLFSWLALISLIVGTLGAVKQTSLKRLVAYSGISHMGFVFFGLASGTGFGLIATLSYFLIYLLLNSIWIIVMWTNKDDHLESLQNLYPWLAFFLTVTMFSIAGVPPLSGFFMKFYLLFSLIQVSNYLGGLFLILFSVISAYYYLRIIRVMYFSSSLEGVSKTRMDCNISGFWFLIFLVYLIIFFVFFQKYLFGFLFSYLG